MLYILTLSLFLSVNFPLSPSLYHVTALCACVCVCLCARVRASVPWARARKKKKKKKDERKKIKHMATFSLSLFVFSPPTVRLTFIGADAKPVIVLLQPPIRPLQCVTGKKQAIKRNLYCDPDRFRRFHNLMTCDVKASLKG